MTIDLLVSGLIQSLILALVTYAVMIPFRLLNCADLTSEGAYPLGGALATVVLLAGVQPVFAVLIAFLGGGLLGFVTSMIHLRLKVSTLLAGIISSTMAYSVSMRIMTKPNVALFNVASLFLPNNDFYNIGILLLVLLIILLTIFLYLSTDFGLKLRAVGLNPEFARKQAISVARYTSFSFFVAGGLAGLAGGLVVQLQNYMDMGIGAGMAIHALAALMLGEVIIGHRSICQQLLAPLAGALLYQQIQGLVLSLGLAASDLKFFTGALVLLAIAFNRRQHHATT